MTTHRIPSFVLLCLLLASKGLTATEPAPVAATDITLSAEDVRRSEVQAAMVPMVSTPPRLTGYATVLDPTPLALLGGEIEALAAAAAASRAEAGRSERLFAADETVSRKATETAQATARADAARLAAAKRRIGLEWGQGLAKLPAHERSQLLASLAEGRAALLRIGLSGNPPVDPVATIRIADGALPLRLLGLAASSDPSYTGPSLLAVAATSALQPGRVLAVSVTGAAQQGQQLPPEAVLSDAQGRFVYLETAAGHYRRQTVQVLAEDDSGVLVSGPPAEARVVLRNAAAVRWASTVRKAE